MTRSTTKRKKQPAKRAGPMLLKLSFNSIPGWWKCLSCGWTLPGHLDPTNHNCRKDAES